MRTGGDRVGRPVKFDSTSKTCITVSVEIPTEEHNIMVMYARGMSINRLCMETGSDYKTIVGVLKRNIGRVFDS